MKKLLAMLVVALGVSSLFAYQYDDGVHKWTLSANPKVVSDEEGINHWIITGCEPAPEGEFTVPAKLGEAMTIWGIDSGAFGGATNLTSVTIPVGIKSIAKNAFKNAVNNCSNLATVKVEGEFEYVDTDAFAGTKFENDNKAKGIVLGGFLVKYAGSDATFTVPEGVKVIADYAFASVPTNAEGKLTLTGVIFNKDLETIGANAFANANGKFAFDSIVIPDSVIVNDEVSNIGDGAFSGCEIKNIKIGAGITDISDFASWFDSPLMLPTESIVFGDGVESIPNGLFSGTMLGSVKFGEGLRKIGDNAFSGCTSLSNVNFTAGIEVIGSSAFRGTALTSVDLSACKLLKTIPSTCFKNCEKLRAVMFNDGLETIGTSAFYVSSAISSLRFPASLKTIGYQAFYGLTNLTEVVLNDGLETIEYQAFARSDNSAGLTSVKIPDSVTCIGGCIFDGCTNLTAITGGAGIVECDSNYLFGGNVPGDPAKKAGVEFGEDGKPLPFGIISFGKVVFGFQGPCASALKAEDFGDAVRIMENAFNGEDHESVSNLVSVAFPAGLEFIGGSAFASAKNLATVDFGDNAANMSIGYMAFCNTAIAELKGDFRMIGESAFAECEKLANVDVTVTAVIEDGVDFDDPLSGVIYGDAFYGCTNLQTVVLRANGIEGILLDDGESGPFVYGGWICDEVLSECPALKQVEIEADGEYVGQVFVGDYDALTSVKLNMPGITGYLCSGLTNLTTVTLGEMVKEIGERAFAGCTALATIDIPTGVETIGYGAFGGCAALATVTGCTGVKAVYADAFARTKFFNEAVKGETVVGPVLFRYVDKGDGKDSELVLSDAIAVIAANAFTSNAIVKITVPAAVERLEKNTFVSCPNLEKVILKNSAIRIYTGSNVPDYCFLDCEKLTMDGFYVEKGGHLFMGWDDNWDDNGKYYNAIFEKLRFHNDATEDGSFDMTTANNYTGWIMDYSKVVGTVTIKTGKADKNSGLIKVTASVQLSGLKKNYTAMFKIDENGKAVIDDEDANWYNELCGMFLGGNWLSGKVTLGGKAYTVRGGNAQNSVESFDNYAGHVWTMALSSNSGENLANVIGYSTLTVTPAKKGKIKVSGVMADGTKVSSTAQMVAGDNGVVAAPVTVGLYQGKRGGFSFLLQFYMDGGQPKMWFEQLNSDGQETSPSATDGSIGSWYLPYVHENYRVWGTASLSPVAVGEVDLAGTGVTADETFVWIYDDVDSVKMLSRKCKCNKDDGILFDGDTLTLDAKGKWTFAKQAKVSLPKEKDLTNYADEIAASINAFHAGQVEFGNFVYTKDGKALEVVDSERDDVMGYWTPTTWLLWDFGAKVDKKSGEVTPGQNTNKYGLKLKYTQKTGAFSGSSQYYWIDQTKPEKPALKKGKFTIGGVAIDGKLYGAAVVKGVSSFFVGTGEIED